jgi:hypothetical protein
MYVQWCVKGISGGAGGITLNESVYLITSGSGIVSNWWRKKQIISPADVSSILNDYNLDRHLHDYANYGPGVAPNFYPVAIGVWRSIMPCWAVVAAVRGAEPSAERSVADRLAAA